MPDTALIGDVGVDPVVEGACCKAVGVALADGEDAVKGPPGLGESIELVALVGLLAGAGTVAAGMIGAAAVMAPAGTKVFEIRGVVAGTGAAGAGEADAIVVGCGGGAVIVKGTSRLAKTEGMERL